MHGDMSNQWQKADTLQTLYRFLNTITLLALCFFLSRFLFLLISFFFYYFFFFCFTGPHALCKCDLKWVIQPSVCLFLLNSLFILSFLILFCFSMQCHMICIPYVSYMLCISLSFVFFWLFILNKIYEYLWETECGWLIQFNALGSKL